MIFAKMNLIAFAHKRKVKYILKKRTIIIYKYIKNKKKGLTKGHKFVTIKIMDYNGGKRAVLCKKSPHKVVAEKNGKTLKGNCYDKRSINKRNTSRKKG